MTKNKIIKAVFILLGLVILIIGGIGFYMFNMPHRNVQAAKSDYKLSASAIVLEYLEDPVKANDKYLDAEGESKILEITGTIASISTDFNNQKVILLKSENAKAGVNATFTEETNPSVANLKEGQKISVKGVIRSGASYDEDLEMYENVILEKCNLINSNQ
jgi:putative nucleic acid binding protein